MRLPGTEDVSQRVDTPQIRDILHGLRPHGLQPQKAGQTLESKPQDEVGDVVDLSGQAAVAQQFQEILKQIEAANDKSGLGDALRALKDFVQEQAKPNMLGDVLQQASHMADNLMSQLEENPDQKFMSLKVAADFSKANMNTQVMVYETVRFDFRLQAVTEDGVVTMNMSMTQSSQRTENYMKFMSQETADVSFVGNMNGLKANPLFAEFGQLADLLLQQVQPMLTSMNGGMAVSYDQLMQLMERSGNSQMTLKMQMLDVLINGEDGLGAKPKEQDGKMLSLLELLNPVEDMSENNRTQDGQGTTA